MPNVKLDNSILPFQLESSIDLGIQKEQEYTIFYLVTLVCIKQVNKLQLLTSRDNCYAVNHCRFCLTISFAQPIRDQQIVSGKTSKQTIKQTNVSLCLQSGKSQVHESLFVLLPFIVLKCSVNKIQTKESFLAIRLSKNTSIM